MGTVVIQDTKSRTVGFNMFTHSSIVQLTNEQSTVFQGHVVFNSEALAQTVFFKWTTVKKKKKRKEKPSKSHKGNKWINLKANNEMIIKIWLYASNHFSMSYLFWTWKNSMLLLLLEAVTFTQLLSTNIPVISLDSGTSVLSAMTIHLPRSWKRQPRPQLCQIKFNTQQQKKANLKGWMNVTWSCVCISSCWVRFPQLSTGADCPPDSRLNTATTAYIDLIMAFF